MDTDKTELYSTEWYTDVHHDNDSTDNTNEVSASKPRELSKQRIPIQQYKLPLPQTYTTAKRQAEGAHFGGTADPEENEQTGSQEYNSQRERLKFVLRGKKMLGSDKPITHIKKTDSPKNKASTEDYAYLAYLHSNSQAYPMNVPSGPRYKDDDPVMNDVIPTQREKRGLTADTLRSVQFPALRSSMRLQRGREEGRPGGQDWQRHDAATNRSLNDAVSVRFKRKKQRQQRREEGLSEPRADDVALRHCLQILPKTPSGTSSSRENSRSKDNSLNSRFCEARGDSCFDSFNGMRDGPSINSGSSSSTNAKYKFENIDSYLKYNTFVNATPVTKLQVRVPFATSCVGQSLETSADRKSVEEYKRDRKSRAPAATPIETTPQASGGYHAEPAVARGLDEYFVVTTPRLEQRAQPRRVLRSGQSTVSQGLESVSESNADDLMMDD